MSELMYNLVEVGDVQNITVVYDGEMYVASNEHPNWTKIVAGAQAHDPEVVNLFDIPKMVRVHLKNLSERITIVDDVFLLDGDPMHNGLTVKVMEALQEGLDDWKPIVAFMEKAITNPSALSMEQLFNWLEHNGFSINEDGDVIGYKGVYTVPEGGFRSGYRGTASVNGVEKQNDHVYQNIGDVVTMARSAVNADPNVACAPGLHISNFAYAKSYGNATVRVLANPRDFVAVPKDHGFQKIRAHRYKVDAEVDRNAQPVKAAVAATDSRHDVVAEEPQGISSWRDQGEAVVGSDAPVRNPALANQDVTVTDTGYTYSPKAAPVSISTGTATGPHIHWTFPNAKVTIGEDKVDVYEEDYFPGVGTWVDAPE